MMHDKNILNMSDNKEVIPQENSGDCEKFVNDETSKSTEIDSLVNISLECDGNLNMVPVSIPNKTEGTQFFIEVDASVAANLSSENHYTLVPVDHQLDRNNGHSEGSDNIIKDDCICLFDNNGMQWSGKVSYFKTSQESEQESAKALTNMNMPSLDDKNKDEQIFISPSLDKENIFSGRSPFISSTASQSKSNMSPPQNNAMPVQSIQYVTSSRHFHPYKTGQLMHPQYHSTPIESKNTARSPLYSHESKSSNLASPSDDSSNGRSIISDNLIPLNNTTVPKNDNNQTTIAQPLDQIQYFVPFSGRENHNEKERKRRNRIKTSCQSLRTLVPGLNDKTDKATVFEYTVQYLLHLKHVVGLRFDQEFLDRFVNRSST